MSYQPEKTPNSLLDYCNGLSFSYLSTPFFWSDQVVENDWGPPGFNAWFPKGIAVWKNDQLTGRYLQLPTTTWYLVTCKHQWCALANFQNTSCLRWAVISATSGTRKVTHNKHFQI
jgi:hypothetical protein